MSVSAMSLKLVGWALMGAAVGVGWGCASSDRDEPRPIGPSTLVLQLADEPEALRRPAVEFDHGVHTTALQKEGCDVCHLVDADKRLTPRFVADAGSDRDVAMDLYHDKCNHCHDQRRAGGAEEAPATCAECHRERAPGVSTRVAMRFDNSLHHRHVEAAQDKCETCHHVYDEKADKLVYEKGAESACRDCHRKRDEDGRPSLRKASHTGCVGCHVQRAAEGKESGPVLCIGCHDATARQAIKKLEPDELPRLMRGQPDLAWIHTAGAESKTVPFNHQAHEPLTDSCSTCHHETLKACKDCHTLTGSPEAHGVPLVIAYHLARSDHSCVGCHKSVSGRKDCSGCHHRLQHPSGRRACTICHSGPVGTPPPTVTVAPVDLAVLPDPSDDFPDELVIDALATVYNPSKLPHREIVAHLDAIVRKSPLASRFHGRTETLCAGCHHHTPVGARPPPCRSCHSAQAGTTTDMPALKPAYHRQCVGCHQQMHIEAVGCTDCHSLAGGKKEVPK